MFGFLEDIYKGIEKKFSDDTDKEKQVEQKKQFDSSVADESTVPTKIKVEKGDTLWGIAHKYNVPLSSLHRSGKDKYLQIGEEVTINPMHSPQVLAKTVSNINSKQQENEVAKTNATNSLPIPNVDKDVQKPSDFTYYAKPGDSINGIAKRFNIPVKALKRTGKRKYLQIGEGVEIRGYKPEFKDLGGSPDIKDHTEVYKDVYGSNLGKGIYDTLFVKHNPIMSDEEKSIYLQTHGKVITNKTFPNSTLKVLYNINKHFGAHLKVGQSISITPDQYLKFLKIKGAGYQNDNIQNTTDNPDVNNIKFSLGGYTLTRTKTGFKVTDVYDFTKGEGNKKVKKGHIAYGIAHKLAEEFMPEDGNKLDKEANTKVDIELPYNIIKGFKPTGG